MAIGYLLGAVTFAVLCSLIWLVLGGTIWGAAGIYLISGQIAIITIFGKTVWDSRRAE